MRTTSDYRWCLATFLVGLCLIGVGANKAFADPASCSDLCFHKQIFILKNANGVGICFKFEPYTCSLCAAYNACYYDTEVENAYCISNETITTTIKQTDMANCTAHCTMPPNAESASEAVPATGVVWANVANTFTNQCSDENVDVKAPIL